MKIVENKIFDEERALYAVRDTEIKNCTFAGAADGESALKECKNIKVADCSFELRYPFWHDDGVLAENSRMTEGCRAPVWYTKNATFKNFDINGVKAFRECDDIKLIDCRAVSPELGWCCRGVEIEGGDITSEYFLLNSSDIRIDGLRFKGKYSFQYTKNVEIHNVVFDTKDAFWHSENVTIYDSEIKGEYAAWYSKNLKLVRCKISGTQPFCYVENLVMEDCETEGCDLSFEYSSVNATIKGRIDSIKNPISGSITADEIGEVIIDENVRAGSDCKIVER